MFWEKESSKGVSILMIMAADRQAAGVSGPAVQPGGGPPAPWRFSWRKRPDAASRPGAGVRARRWRPFSSARSRILGWSVLLLAAAMAAFTIASRSSMVGAMNARIASDLSHEIDEFNAQAGKAPAHATVLSVLHARTSTTVLERDTVLLGIVNGKIVTTSRNFRASLGPPDSVLAGWAALTRPASGTVTMAAGPARYSAVPVHIHGSRGLFVAAVLTAPQQAAIDSLTGLQVEVGAVALLIGSLLAWLVAGRVLSPVRATTELARRITETDLSERIPGRGRDEVSELAVTFNDMLDRLQAAMITQRRFLADAGHELRTPITIIQGNLDTLTAGSEDDAETLTIVADEISRMNRLVDELLLLADSERPDFLRQEPTDLARLTRALLAKAQALADRPWVLTSVASGVAVLDPQRVTQAVMQLAVNATVYTPPGSAVEIGSAASDGMVIFTVADHGPGIPAGARTQIFGRFARLDSRRTDGTGLGLAIVAAIATAHRGSAAVGDRGDGGQGAAFRLAIPYVPAPGVPPDAPPDDGSCHPRPAHESHPDR